MAKEYVSKEAVLNAIHSGDIDMGMVTPQEYRLLQELSRRIDRRIQRVPVSDVRPVRHGCWEASYMKDFLACSECVHYWIYKGDQYDYHYCPNCGADMREVDNG